jgi:hypothetical protein
MDKRGAAAGFLVLADTDFGCPAHIKATGLAESLKQSVEEDYA